MKLLKTVFYLVLFAFVITACDWGLDGDRRNVVASQNVIIEDRQVQDFNRLTVSNAFDVELIISEGPAEVSIEADDNLQSFIVVYQEGDWVHIGLVNDVNIRGSATLRAYVDVTALNAVEISGASRLNIRDTVNSEDFLLILSGASQTTGILNITGRSTIELSGASSVELFGYSNALDAVCSGASSFSGYDLLVDDLTIQLSGASNGRLTVLSTLDVTASGASSFEYRGTGVIENVSVSGSSLVEKVD